MTIENKKYLIIGIIVVLIVIIGATTYILTSNNNGNALDLSSSNVEILNVDQYATHYNSTEFSDAYYSYVVSFTLDGLDENKNYSAKATWYDMDGKKVLTTSQAIDYDIYEVEGGAIKYFSLGEDSPKLFEFSNCTIQIMLGNNVVAEYTYEWVNSPISSY